MQSISVPATFPVGLEHAWVVGVSVDSVTIDPKVFGPRVGDSIHQVPSIMCVASM